MQVSLIESSWKLLGNIDAPAISHMVLAANGGHLGHPEADAMNQRRTIDQKAA